MYGSQSTHAWLPYISFCLFFLVFQMSAILRAFALQLWNWAALLIFTCSSFLWSMKFNLRSFIDLCY